MQNLNYRYYLLMVLPFMLAMCLVKNLRYIIYNQDMSLNSSKVEYIVSLIWFISVILLQIFIAIFDCGEYNPINWSRDNILLHICKRVEIIGYLAVVCTSGSPTLIFWHCYFCDWRNLCGKISLKYTTIVPSKYLFDTHQMK